jgi:tetratricopeptide (TPR) repeat protein
MRYSSLRAFARALKVIAPLSVALLAVAGCSEIDYYTGGTVGRDSQTGQDIVSGNYTGARDMLKVSYPQHPDDPYQQFNLAYVYEKLGQPDLAEPLYRQAIKDGGNTYPNVYLSGEREGASLGELACTHLKGMLKNPGAC